jgi:NAD(P)-dependent dehydrogenase (short-subunit alcohol dehydrogenase family)
MTQKIALVTGASRGLGRSMALALAKSGNDLIITYRSEKKLAEEVAKEIEILGRKVAVMQLDVSKPGTLNAFVAELITVLQQTFHADGFDFLINNAGIGKTLPIADVTEDIFDELMNIHFKSVYFLTQKCLPIIRNNGAVVNVSTGTTRFCVPGYSVYSSFKSAVETFTKYIAKEYGNRGIRANVIAPGPIETDFNNAAIRNNPQMKGFLTAQIPLGRVGEADDIGGVVSFLCSDDARWVNGHRLEASGGINL